MLPQNYEKLSSPLKTSEIFDLKDRIGIIVGGAGKMGQQFATVLTNAGAQVILADVNESALEETQQKLRAQTKAVIETICCDVSKPHDVERLFASVRKSHDHLDFLVCNTMAKPQGYYQSFEDYSKESWDKVIESNLTGAFLCCQRAYQLMRIRKSGSIVITSSVYGMVSPDFRIYEGCKSVKNPYGGGDPMTAPVSYTVSKGGLIALTKYLAVLFAPDNIRVNTFTPAGVYDNHEESFHQAYVNRVPLGRMAVWSDYNGALLFLVSDASRYMTGANLIIDGGWTAW